MAPQRRSYLKTVVTAGGITAALSVIAGLIPGRPGVGSGILAGMLVVMALAAGIVALTGLVVIWRDQEEEARRDPFLRFNASRYEHALAGDGAAIPWWRRWYRGLLRRLTGQPFLVGDVVEVRDFREIRRTLDANGCLEGMPFMPEMLPHCGRHFRVFRYVDKLYDYGGRKNLRRARDMVLLAGLRCDGSAHDRCQAGCYLLWKNAWLRPASGPRVAPPIGDTDRDWLRGLARRDGADGRRYMCQYTQVVSASAPLHLWDLRQDLLPLLTGNVTLRAFVLAILTRLFNRVQSWRSGIGYPFRPPGGGAQGPVPELGLQPGERVRVRDKAEIAATLNEYGRNRGLWFDQDMIRHCNRSYSVLMRVDRIIDDATARMVPMKTPCIILDGVYTSGETLRFTTQHDYSFWREAWLQRER